jgi:putative phosphoesterase
MLLCVRGNCDTEVDQMVLDFPILADYCILELDGHTLFATHGHRYNRQNLPPMGTGEILLHGHTHIPENGTCGEIRILNPGSVSIPKGGSVGSYMTYEKGTFLWKDLDGEVYDTLNL